MNTTRINASGRTPRGLPLAAIGFWGLAAVAALGGYHALVAVPRVDLTPTELAAPGSMAGNTPLVSLAPATPARRAEPAQHNPISRTALSETASPVVPGADTRAMHWDAANLIADIRYLGTHFADLSAAEVGELEGYFAGLIRLGRSAVPAIREYLQSGEDAVFEAQRDRDAAIYPSLRVGLIELLGAIGGRDAMVELTGMLATTTAPREIAALASALELQAPGVYREELLSAARHSMQAAAEAVAEARKVAPKQREVVDVSPLFDVMRAFGDADLLHGLLQDVDQSMPPWKVYSMIALVQMPDGEGVPILRSALVGEDESLATSNLFALQMLAQAARENPNAADALVDVATVHGQEIPASDWRKLAWTLRGHAYDFGGTLDALGSFSPDIVAEQQVNIPSLNLNLRRTASDPATWLPGEVEQQVEMIDLLLALRPPDDAAYALERSRDWILQRAWSL